MKRFLKHYTLPAVLVALFAALSISASAVEPAVEPDLSLVFSPETQLTVYVNGEWDAALSGGYGYSESVSLTAPATAGDKTFSHWEANGAVISYDNPLKLTMNAHTTLFAVYADAAPTAKPAAGFTSITRSTDGEQIVLHAKTSGETAGFVYSTKTSGEDLKIGGTDVTDVAAVKLTDDITAIPQSALDRNNCYTLRIEPESDDTVYHVRTYVTVDNETTYSDVKDVKLSELPDGISLIANLEGFWPGINEALDGLTDGMRIVTYDANGGVGAAITQAFLGDSVTLRANTFTREGYAFSGWSTTPTGSAVYTDGQSVTLSENLTLYAQWQANSGNNNSDSSSGGSVTPAPVTTHSGETATTADGAAVTKELDASTSTKQNTDGTVTVTDKTAETVTTENTDGSKVETKTEIVNAETTGSKKNADGSVTDTTKVSSTETVKETATDANGGKTVTETKTEQNGNTAVTTKENADGSKSEKTETTETVKVTEKVTDERGKTTETVTTTKTETVTDMTSAKDGTATGTSTTTTTVTDDKGKVLSTAVTEAEIKASTDENGTTTTETIATTTITDADGKETVEKTVTTEYEAPDGSTGTIVKDESGNILSQETTISQQEAEAARDEGRPAQSPLVVTPVPEEKAESASPVQINMPSMLYDRDGDGIVTVAEMPKVEIQVTYTRPGVIGMFLDLLNRWLPIKECREGSVIVPVTGSEEIVIVDNTKTFNDVNTSEWYGEYVTFVTAREIFNGTGNGIFDPNAPMTRAMLAQVLYNFARDAEAGNGTVFEDVTSADWFNAAIGWAYEKGVVNGYGDRFGATDNISRQDLATILYRFAKSSGYDVSVKSSLSSYADAGSVADYAKEAMEWAVGAGLINGMSDGTLSPKGNATRAQVAAIMTRFVRNAK